MACGTIRGKAKLDNRRIKANLLQSYYNFIRPHMGLNRKTPAEVSGIKMNLQGNRWKAIIDKVAKSRMVP
jgi:hypothetical protein